MEKVATSAVEAKISDAEQWREALLILRTLNNKTTQKILRLIEKEGKINVTEIYVKLRMEQSVVSNHLKMLREIGAVTTDRQGKFVYYAKNEERIEKYTEASKKLIEIKNE